jgi:8-oxo-dGTP diphosphatase
MIINRKEDGMNLESSKEQIEKENALTESEFIKQYDSSKYEKPSVTVDIMVFTVIKDKLCVLLIKRGRHPFKDAWAIPGGFLHMDESAEEAAVRRIREEAGVENVHLEQLYTFSDVERDPRTRVISIAYHATVPAGKLHFLAGSGANEAALF